MKVLTTYLNNKKHAYILCKKDEAGLFNLAIFNYGTDSRLLWKDRFRWCWNILRKGIPWCDQVVLSEETAFELANILIEDRLGFEVHKEFLEDEKLYDRCLECDMELKDGLILNQVFCSAVCRKKNHRKREELFNFYKSKITEGY